MIKPHVHVIDDEEAICREVVSALEHRGYPGSWSTDPLATRDPAHAAPDVIVLDLAMPRADGFQVIAALAEAATRPRLVVASGHDSRIIKAAVLSANSAGIPVLGALAKPYSIQALLDLLELYDHAEPKPNDDTGAVKQLIDSGALLGNVRVAFQCKRRLSDERVIGYEALLRLDAGRPLSPEAAFSDAVDLQVQLAITERVMDQAMIFASVLRASGQPVPVAVNCSPTLICAPQFMAMLTMLLDRHSLPPELLIIEITEHNSLATLAEVGVATSRIAMLGCGVAVDDFGQGATSFEKLLKLPLTELKVDKQLFWDCTNGTLPRAVLSEIVHLGRNRGLCCTIEGIETREQLQIANALGACHGQGFLWGVPRLGVGSIN